MGNIKDFNFNKLDMFVSNSDYWDLYLANDGGGGNSSGLTSGDCFVVWYDFNNPNIFDISGETIHSLVYWTGGTNTGYTLNTIGLTGIDNGLILFDKTSGDTSNQALLSALTGSTLVIPSGTTKMFMNPVSGTTGNFIYPITQITESGLTYSNFCGGFYQGFYKLDGYSYEVLPTRVNKSWSAEFWLKPQDICPYTGQTLNDVYTGNTGFFFYMGTRAENKFWNQWFGADTGCTSACTSDSGCTETLSEWCTIPKENEIYLTGDYGVAIPLDPPQVEIDLVTNGFMVYGRAYSGNCSCSSCSGPNDGLGRQTVCTYAGTGIVTTHTSEVITNNTNGFLIYGRAYSGNCSCSSCSGPNDGYGNQTVCTFSGRTTPETELNYVLDEADNALGFRITPDGRVGYRALLSYTGECSGKTMSSITITEDYSEPIITNDIWSYVVIKFVTSYEDDCKLKTSKRRKGDLMIYVNAKLKKVFKNVDEFIARRLLEYKDKQVGVPFNMSIGGGTQGLLESQTFDGRDPNDLGLAIENNFAGTFIGGISDFKFNICTLSYADIQYNFNLLAPIHGITIKNYGNC